MSLLQIENLRVQSGPLVLVDQLSLSVDAGEIVVLAGESGSGKSLTAYSILRLAPPGLTQTGAIRLNGQDLSELGEKDLQSVRGGAIGMVFQEPMTALNPVMSIGDQIAETVRQHRRCTRAEARATARAMLGRVGLLGSGVTPERFAHQLSGGQRQRAAIAMAIALKPRLILADEPTTALDVTTQAEIVALLTQLTREDQAGLLFITHDLALAAQIADRVAIMQAGKVVESGPTLALFDHMSHPYSKALLAAARPSPYPARPRRRHEPAVLEALNLSRDYAEARPHPFAAPALRRVLDDASLFLHRGEIVALVGASGSGKTTFARTLLALEPPQAGEVRLIGEAFSHADPASRRKLRSQIQAVFQDPFDSLDPRWTVKKIVAEPLDLAAPNLDDVARRNQVEAILMEVGLSPEHADRYPHEFSGGQRQRIAIARALIAEPRVIVLDEATSALDVTTRAQILQLIHDLALLRQVAFLLVTHDLTTVRTLADRVIVMHKGKVVEVGPTERVFNNPQHAHTRDLIAATPDIDRALAARRRAQT